ncbi:hypothetical protein [Amycolatopsis sp. cmx-11-32]|uniref:hypothetical protein n=1 Tax=Amycolatopsis sp. cmx-11-32 TaxID=2785796 RepID=UPI0039E52160
MSSTTDFYLGRGPDAEWLGSVLLDTRDGLWLEEITRARSAGGFINPSSPSSCALPRSTRLARFTTADQ